LNENLSATEQLQVNENHGKIIQSGARSKKMKRRLISMELQMRKEGGTSIVITKREKWEDQPRYTVDEIRGRLGDIETEDVFLHWLNKLRPHFILK
jgi:hypothetical protein